MPRPFEPFRVSEETLGNYRGISALREPVSASSSDEPSLGITHVDATPGHIAVVLRSRLLCVFDEVPQRHQLSPDAQRALDRFVWLGENEYFPNVLALRTDAPVASVHLFRHSRSAPPSPSPSTTDHRDNTTRASALALTFEIPQREQPHPHHRAALYKGDDASVSEAGDDLLLVVVHCTGKLMLWRWNAKVYSWLFIQVQMLPSPLSSSLVLRDSTNPPTLSASSGPSLLGLQRNNPVNNSVPAAAERQVLGSAIWLEDAHKRSRSTSSSSSSSSSKLFWVDADTSANADDEEDKGSPPPLTGFSGRRVLCCDLSHLLRTHSSSATTPSSRDAAAARRGSGGPAIAVREVTIVYNDADEGVEPGDQRPLITLCAGPGGVIISARAKTNAKKKTGGSQEEKATADDDTDAKEVGVASPASGGEEEDEALDSGGAGVALYWSVHHARLSLLPKLPKTRFYMRFLAAPHGLAFFAMDSLGSLHHLHGDGVGGLLRAESAELEAKRSMIGTISERPETEIALYNGGHGPGVMEFCLAGSECIVAAGLAPDQAARASSPMAGPGATLRATVSAFSVDGGFHLRSCPLPDLDYTPEGDDAVLCARSILLPRSGGGGSSARGPGSLVEATLPSTHGDVKATNNNGERKSTEAAAAAASHSYSDGWGSVLWNYETIWILRTPSTQSLVSTLLGVQDLDPRAAHDPSKQVLSPRWLPPPHLEQRSQVAMHVCRRLGVSSRRREGAGEGEQERSEAAALELAREVARWGVGRDYSRDMMLLYKLKAHFDGKADASSAPEKEFKHPASEPNPGDSANPSSSLLLDAKGLQAARAALFYGTDAAAASTPARATSTSVASLARGGSSDRRVVGEHGAHGEISSLLHNFLRLQRALHAPDGPRSVGDSTIVPRLASRARRRGGAGASVMRSQRLRRVLSSMGLPSQARGRRASDEEIKEVLKLAGIAGLREGMAPGELSQIRPNPIVSKTSRDISAGGASGRRNHFPFFDAMVRWLDARRPELLVPFVRLVASVFEFPRLQAASSIELEGEGDAWATGDVSASHGRAGSELKLSLANTRLTIKKPSQQQQRYSGLMINRLMDPTLGQKPTSTSSSKKNNGADSAVTTKSAAVSTSTPSATKVVTGISAAAATHVSTSVDTITSPTSVDSPLHGPPAPGTAPPPRPPRCPGQRVMRPLTFALHALYCLPPLKDGGLVGGRMAEARLQARCLLCLVDESLDLPKAVGYCLRANRCDMALRLVKMLLPPPRRSRRSSKLKSFGAVATAETKGDTKSGMAGAIKARSTGEAQKAVPSVEPRGEAPASQKDMQNHFEAFATAVEDDADAEGDQEPSTSRSAQTDTPSSSRAALAPREAREPLSLSDPEVATIIGARNAPSESDIRVTRAEVFHQLIGHWLAKGARPFTLPSRHCSPDGKGRRPRRRSRSMTPTSLVDKIWAIRPDGFTISSLLRVTRTVLGAPGLPSEGETLRITPSEAARPPPPDGVRRVTVGELKPHLKKLMKEFRRRSSRRYDQAQAKQRESRSNVAKHERKT